MIEYGANRAVVGDRDRITDLVRAECPEEGDALRSRKRQVVTRTAPLGNPGPEVFSKDGLAHEEIAEPFRVHPPCEPKRLGSGPNPLSRRFTPT